MHTRDLFGKTPDNAPASLPDCIVSGRTPCTGCASCTAPTCSVKTPDNASAPSPDRIVSGCVLCLGCALCSGCVSRTAATRSVEPPKAGRLSESVAGRDRRSSFPRAAMPNRQCLATPAHTHQQGGYIRRGGTTQQPVWKRPYGMGKPGKHIRHRRVPLRPTGVFRHLPAARPTPRRNLRVDLPAENMSGFPTD